MYKDNYHGYPASLIRLDIIDDRLKNINAKKILDVGCGTCGPMIRFLKRGYHVRGIDFSSSMIDEGKIELAKAGFDPDLIGHGDVENIKTIPNERFDVAIASGVFPHIEDESKALTNIKKRLKKNGRVFIEFRNDLFASYTLNRYSYDFYLNRLINLKKIPPKIQKEILRFYSKLDIKQPKSKNSKIGFTDILAKFHNPLTLGKELFEPTGFTINMIHFYHYHALPPIFDRKYPEIFKKLSLRMEDPSDWRGYFMASAFVVEAIKK